MLEASLTWCRPCKGFERAFQVCSAVTLPQASTLPDSMIFLQLG